MAISRCNYSHRRALLLTLAVLLGFCCLSSEAGRAARKQKEIDEMENMAGAREPNIHFLIEMLGKEIYRAINRPKYKLYIYMTIGKLPDEASTIFLLDTICDVGYGLIVFFGFLFLPRVFMLFMTLVTLYIGPALVLMLLGSIAAMLAAFALYPVTSVICVWLFFFSTSKLAQTIGRNMGLDRDEDGDVDLLDLLHLMADNQYGRYVGLMKLHHMLNEHSKDPFVEIHRRLDAIQTSTRHIEKTSSTVE